MFTVNEVIGIVFAALSAFTGIMYLYFKDFYRLKQSNTIAKKKEREILSLVDKLADPANHPFFVKIKFYINNESWHLGIDENNECCTHIDIEQCLSEPKKNIMSDMLRAKLSYWYCGYRELFFGRTKFDAKRVKKTVLDIIERYEKEWVRIGVPLYIQEQFKRKHQKRAEGIFQLMEELFKKSENKSQISIEYAKMHLLDYSIALLDNTISDINFVLRGIKLREEDELYVSRYKNPIKGKTDEEIEDFCP